MPPRKKAAPAQPTRGPRRLWPETAGDEWVTLDDVVREIAEDEKYPKPQLNQASTSPPAWFDMTRD